MALMIKLEVTLRDYFKETDKIMIKGNISLTILIKDS